MIMRFGVPSGWFSSINGIFSSILMHDVPVPNSRNISLQTEEICLVFWPGTPKFFTTKFADHSRGVPAVIISIPAGIQQLSDPSTRYSRNIHTHTRGNAAETAAFPPSPSPCTPLVHRWHGVVLQSGSWGTMHFALPPTATPVDRNKA